MLETSFWAVFVRTGQLAVEASTTLLCGFVAAGVMRRMLGASGLRQLFGGTGWKGLVRAWAVGTVLPVCALGVIPIARELRRAGVPTGTILAFVLAAPHINPLSLLYGLTLSEPVVIITFALGSLVIALAAGATWEWVFSPTAGPLPADEPAPAPGFKRLAAVVTAAARETVGPTTPYVLLGLGFTGLMAGLLPLGCLGRTMRHDDPISPLLMAALALPAYSGSLPGMMRLGLMFEHGNSVGAAFILFELGIGLNVGTIAWLTGWLGRGRILAWVGFVTVLSLGLAYAAEGPLYFAHEEASHTHAFDDWTSPYPAGFSVHPAEALGKVAEKIEILEPVSLAGLGFLFSLGLALRSFDPSGRLDAWLAKAPPPVKSTKFWDRPLPGPVLGAAGLAGLVVFSVAALYVYYPAPKEAFDEMVRVKADALTSVNAGNREEAIRQIERWDLLTRKVQVGAVIRTGRLDAAAAATADDLRERLEELRDALLAGNGAEAKELVRKVEAAYRHCRETYLPGAPTPAAGAKE
ncbi:MAG: hypothetical protein JWO38_3492 [Gemmataceae bacterium]|nr:hypothetical protein [Gemmataceae bacterium]